VSIVAFNKAGGQADVGEAIESFKSEIEATVNELRKVGAETIAQMETKLQLVEAKAHLLAAKMYIALDKNYGKAAEELNKAADNFEKARTRASEATRKRITRLKSGITEAQKYVGDKSAQAIDKVTNLLKEAGEAVDSLDKESLK